MVIRLLTSLILTCFISSHAISQSDSLIYAEGRVINASTKEPVNARISYQSLPYGNKIGVINNSVYSFPMFDGEKYEITVEAAGFSPAKYMLDPSEADNNRKVVRVIELSSTTSTPDVRHMVGHVMRLDKLIFEVGKSKIDPDSYSELDLVVQMMNQNPKMVIQLEGHTDYLGDEKENLKLSHQRVESVKNYLASQGIAKARLKTKAFGGTQPISKDNTPEAHRINRRVEVRILQN